ncbi:hypothetical protein CMK12_10020 [Candidatus Poribacteria bacterium]|nr:hypothetical protein [Candidatus Poribacteria bacterium]
MGDIVADFVASCRKYDLRPAYYYHTGYNAYCNMDNPGRVRSGDAEAQARYNRIVYQQCTELWSNYGPLFEIWFDGGILPPDQWGPDVVSLLWDLQPQAVIFQGPKGTGSLIVGSKTSREEPQPTAGVPSVNSLVITNLHSQDREIPWVRYEHQQNRICQTATISGSGSKMPLICSILLMR